MAIIQWVNLEKDVEYENDPDIKKIDRCGKLTIKTIYEKDKIPVAVKFKLSPSGGTNLTYNAAELIRNPNFKGTTGLSDVSTEVEVLLEGEFQLPAAGGNKYKIEAKDENDNLIESAEVEVKRKLYYQFMHMEDSVDATKKVTPYALTQLENHCNKYHVVLTKAGTDKKIPFHKTISMNLDGNYTYSNFGSDVKNVYDISVAHKKVGCAAVLSCYIATRLQAPELVRTITIGTPSSDTHITSTSVQLKGDKHLWHGLDDADDTVKNWFVSGNVEYVSSVAGSTPTLLTIDRADVGVAGTASNTHGGHKHVAITITPALQVLLSNTQGTLTFKILLNIVAGFSGGFSYDPGSCPITTCSTKSWWEDNSPSNSDVIWNHEVGHRMGMVAYGNKDHRTSNPKFFYKPKLPDAPTTLYGENRDVNNKGHQGPHCEKGVTYNAANNIWSGTPGCVLFGATAVLTATGSVISSPLDYCADCTDIVKKLDLSF
jgi:hypothetical protein